MKKETENYQICSNSNCGTLIPEKKDKCPKCGNDKKITIISKNEKNDLLGFFS